MGHHANDLTGKRFGILSVIERAPNKIYGKNSRVSWLCLCDCGRFRTVAAYSLVDGLTKSCGHGCTKRSRKQRIVHEKQYSKHRMSSTPTYRSWSAMKNRCTNPKHPCYDQYESLGICPDFLDFSTFYAHMGNRPPGTSIGRIDNSKGYFIGNVRWETRTQQNRNTKRNQFLTINGKTQCLSVWAIEFGVSITTIKRRIKKGELPAIDS